MKKHCMNIFSCICTEIRNNPLTHTADVLIIKKIHNKQALRLFISCILYPFILFLSACIPKPVCAGEIMNPESGHEIGDLFLALHIENNLRII